MSLPLRSVSDGEILSRTKALSIQERNITLSLLLHLNEIERRKLHLTLGHASMFDYCTAGLGYSTAAAVRRIQTARCIVRFPQVEGMLACNEVNLSTVSRVSKILTAENGHAVLDRIRNRSQREVEAIVAESEPLSVLPRDRVRTVVVRVPAAKPEHIRNGCAEHDEPEVCKATSATTGCDMGTGEPVGRPTNDRPLAGPGTILAGAATLERRSIVQFSAREEVMATLQRVRSLASHRLRGNASLEQVIEFLAGYFIEREDPAVRQERREGKARRSTREKEPQPCHNESNPRHIPTRVRDQVFARDRHRCSYVAANGRRCESTHALQIDHVKPVARGGAGTIDNLRLLCAQHNRFEAGRLMGSWQRE